MTKAKHFRILAILVPLLLGLFLSPSQDIISLEHLQPNLDTTSQKDGSLQDVVGHMDSFVTAQDSKSGILEPNRMTQRGHQQTGTIRARTDSGKNTVQNITIDEANGWKVERTEISVSQLRKLYAKDDVKEWNFKHREN